MAADGGPAFPYSALEPDEKTRQLVGSIYADNQGMSLRDYFAAQALPSVLAHYLTANGNGCAADHALRNVPTLAYKYADAMLAERAK